MRPRVDLQGRLPGTRWTVLERVPPRAHVRDRLWRCRCTCGEERVVRAHALLRALRGGGRGASRSCGCLRLERVRAALARRYGKAA